ncbi:Uncharacterised protein [Candidatus Venteria ishoeyi]|uniref:Uncharacterized protein n=1 Tax=Candidatus Venteria ishoeyi TaxID=1899563 RepID=A0A1H6F7A1_9GAMM|nr:Uncharacterised protein [Candidatus Venteria ishoeyi]
MCQHMIYIHWFVFTGYYPYTSLKLVRTVPPPCRRGLGGGDLKAVFLLYFKDKGRCMITTPLSPPARRGGCFCCLPPGFFPFIPSCEEEAGMCRCIILKLVRTVPPPCRRGLGGGDLKAVFLLYFKDKGRCMITTPLSPPARRGGCHVPEHVTYLNMPRT